MWSERQQLNDGNVTGTKPVLTDGRTWKTAPKIDSKTSATIPVCHMLTLYTTQMHGYSQDMTSVQSLRTVFNTALPDNRSRERCEQRTRHLSPGLLTLQLTLK